jgi:hypothetical protein
LERREAICDRVSKIPSDEKAGKESVLLWLALESRSRQSSKKSFAILGNINSRASPASTKRSEFSRRKEKSKAVVRGMVFGDSVAQGDVGYDFKVSQALQNRSR